MTTENEELANHLAMSDENNPVFQARRSADKVTAYIEGLDEADRILNEEIAVITAKIEANHRKKLKARARRKQLRQMANELEMQNDDTSS